MWLIFAFLILLCLLAIWWEAEEMKRKEIQGQKVFFPSKDDRGKSFEFKRAEKQARKEQTGQMPELIIVLPYVHSNQSFVVTRRQDGSWHCQACARIKYCSHVRRIRDLLALRIEARYLAVSEQDWLKKYLVIGEVKR